MNLSDNKVLRRSIADLLPRDWKGGTFVGRLALPEGPTPVVISRGRLRDVSEIAPTASQFIAAWPCDLTLARPLGPVETTDAALVLAPVDLQVVKASGVTFAASAIERVIEERARGDKAAAAAIRASLAGRIGRDLTSVRPGSSAAEALKAALIADGLWSPYLEVAIGPDAEIFTKAPVLSAVGPGAAVGVRSDSAWNNPEPEVVLVCDAQGRAVGATLGNDVNLRDIEGRSALLLGKAKDNNASCALGPFVRLFDDTFGLDDVRSMTVALEIIGDDGFELVGESSMTLISRDPLDLVEQASGRSHQYPDGFALFMGTMFAPVADRAEPGHGFTHREENRVTTCERAPPWTFGIADLMRNLAERGLLAAASPDSKGTEVLDAGRLRLGAS
jgi:fumarylacetoacetate (FAA) hydrolase family protein